MGTSHADAKATIVKRLRFQSESMTPDSSPLYIHLLRQATADVEAGGPVWRVLQGREHDPGPSNLALRFMGAVHRLALDGRAPALAAVYPSSGGSGDVDAAWPAFLAAVEDNVDELRDGVLEPVQTNEVGRCSVLLPCFLAVERRSGLPLRTLEIGSSAGLNLRWDHYRYRAGDVTWGPPDSPLDLGDVYQDTPPLLDLLPEVAERRGCDVAPIDPTTPEGERKLLSFVWPDQLHRFDRLRRAIEVSRAVPATVDTAEATKWVTEQLATARRGVCTVVFHSIVMQYLSPEQRQSFQDALHEAGARATPNAPLAWVRMEPTRDGPAHVDLTWWPGGVESPLAECGYHGEWVRWIQ